MFKINKQLDVHTLGILLGVGEITRLNFGLPWLIISGDKNGSPNDPIVILNGGNACMSPPLDFIRDA